MKGEMAGLFDDPTEDRGDARGGAERLVAGSTTKKYQQLIRLLFIVPAPRSIS